MKEALSGNSDEEAECVRAQIVMMRCKACVFKEDLTDSSEAEGLVPFINKSTPLHALINRAGIFESRTMEITSLGDEHKRPQINLTAPLLMELEFARQGETDLRVVST